MKILFVSAVLPYPLHSGGQIRIYNLLKRLSAKHEIHLYSFIRSDTERAYLSELKFCKYVTAVLRGRAWQAKYIFKTITNSYPFLWNTYHNSEMLSLLSEEVAKGNYDLIHIEPGYVWPSIPTEHRTPIAIAEHNIEHTIYAGYVRQFPVSPMRPFLSLDVAKMIKWEKRIWAAAAGIIAVSSEDKAVIGASTDSQKIAIVPNGVDVDSFVFRPKKTFPDNPIFLYVGNFRWMENRDAAEYLIARWWPAIKETYPHAGLRIVGAHAPKGPYYVGRVDNIQKELQAADIMLAPIRIGGGSKYKILEAMASGLPVIATPYGIKGMLGAPSKHFLIAEDTADVIGSVKYLQDDEVRMSLCKNARELIEKEYSWDLIAEKLNTIWNSLS